MSTPVWVFVILMVAAAIIGTFAFLELPEGAEEKPPVVVPGASFDQTGNLVINNPGMEPGVWHLVFETPGQPARTTRLEFTLKSQCASWLGTITCQPDTFDVGDRVRILGEPTGNNTVRVLRLEHQ